MFLLFEGEWISAFIRFQEWVFGGGKIRGFFPELESHCLSAKAKPWFGFTNDNMIYETKATHKTVYAK